MIDLHFNAFGTRVPVGLTTAHVIDASSVTKTGFIRLNHLYMVYRGLEGGLTTKAARRPKQPLRVEYSLSTQNLVRQFSTDAESDNWTDASASVVITIDASKRWRWEVLTRYRSSPLALCR